MIRVRFKNQWEGFDAFRNPLLRVLRASGLSDLHIITSAREPVDLEIGSVYPTRVEKAVGLSRVLWDRALRSSQDARTKFLSPGKSKNAAYGIWYTPENVRPPDEGWDATLSFEVQEWGRNAYLPFWQLNSDLFGRGDEGFLGRPLVVDELIQPRRASPSQRLGFCCAVIRNPEPTRLRAIKELERLGKVDVYGPLSGRPIGEKLSVMSQYRFALCFENDLYPGYVTEKAFDAWVAGAIPIYWGWDAAASLNPEALVNFSGLSGFEALLEEVAYLERDHEKLDTKASSPLLLSRPEIGRVTSLVSSVLAGG